MKRIDRKNLLNERLLRFIQVLLEILHEGCAARSHSRGVAGVGLVLAVDVTVGIADVDLTKCGKEINTGTIGSPEFGGAEFSITNIAGEQWAATIISGCL